MDSETDIHLPDPLRLLGSDKAAEHEGKRDAAQARVAALVAVARYHGVDLDRGEFRAPPGEVPSPAALVTWARENGLWAKATRLRWRQLIRMQSDAPLVLLFADGGAGILVSRDANAGVVYLKDPSRPGDEPVAVDELRLTNLWHGDVLLVRRERGTSAEEEPFSFAWITRLVAARAPEPSGDRRRFDQLERPADPAAFPHHGRNRPGDHPPDACRRWA